MPSFLNFKDLRRRSRASFRTDQSTDTSSDGSNGATPTTGSLTPPSLAPQSDPALDQWPLKDKLTPSSSAPTRPPLQPHSSGAGSKRHSVSGMTGLGSPMAGPKGPQLPVSQYAPSITNIQNGSWVYQKVLIVHGTIGNPANQAIDGYLTVHRMDDGFPPVTWPVSESHFKALVYLMPGSNKLRFEFSSPKLANNGSSNNIHTSYLAVNMITPLNAPPLQLAILVGRDSPMTYDAAPARVEREGNGLDLAARKFRMAAYLWQAYTAEQMARHKLGRRTFRFEEEWTQGTANIRDLEQGAMRSEARIHVIRSDRTVAEIRDLNRAQQNPGATDKGALFGFAADAVKKYLDPLPGQKQYVSVLLLDAHWDRQAQVITGHAALGGSVGNLSLAIFGSHCLQSYPASFEEVEPAFTDCTPTDTEHVANDCNDAGSSWEAANLGIGAHLHETGHLFGCPHQVSGVMLRDYVNLHRSFVAREAYSTRTREKGGLVHREDECTWHRLDCLRFRAHPCFRWPNDPPLRSDGGVQAWRVEGGDVVVTAQTGVSFIELYGEGDDLCRSWLEYPSEPGAVQRQLTLTEQDLRARLPQDRRKGRIRLSVKSHGGGSLDIDDFKELSSKSSVVRVGNPLTGLTAYRSKMLGASRMEGSQPQEVVFASALRQDRVLSRVIFYHGAAFDGMEFVYDDDSRQLFGKQGGKEGGDCFDMDVRRGEYIAGFLVRSGFWVDAVQVLTSMGRKSPVYGNAQGGDAHTLIPPRGYRICGVSGSAGPWVDGFAVLITK